ncbi:hypothetical protein [Chitinophaga sancti]|uniref:Transmembrane protein n=1 Tax=Chitinophaga sancti TaxID=1004 RepID=A0ABZ0XJ31_9BACT|nr:hypothetical protein [Chitinophaga sancti]WQD63709.1 hypothetical protein U0033_04820 [Chitinophaga sancti]WQG90666.1 hypothetical protein SR876_04100 [Chitinophaga sancti]
MAGDFIACCAGVGTGFIFWGYLLMKGLTFCVVTGFSYLGVHLVYWAMKGLVFVLLLVLVTWEFFLVFFAGERTCFCGRVVTGFKLKNRSNGFLHNVV